MIMGLYDKEALKSKLCIQHKSTENAKLARRSFHSENTTVDVSPQIEHTYVVKALTTFTAITQPTPLLVAGTGAIIEGKTVSVTYSYMTMVAGASSVHSLVSIRESTQRVIYYLP